jgi:hypothetical protein
MENTEEVIRHGKVNVVQGVRPGSYNKRCNRPVQISKKRFYIVTHVMTEIIAIPMKKYQILHGKDEEGED